MLGKFTCALIGLAAVLAMQPALACSCVALDPKRLPKMNVVFLARVNQLETKPAGAGPWNVRIVVVRSWKGPVPAEARLQVHTAGPTEPCGFFIHVGDEMLVYSDDAQHLDLALCNTVRGEEIERYLPDLERAARAGVTARP